MPRCNFRDTLRDDLKDSPPFKPEPQLLWGLVILSTPVLQAIKIATLLAQTEKPILEPSITAS